jgi:hypothetical protein
LLIYTGSFNAGVGVAYKTSHWSATGDAPFPHWSPGHASHVSQPYQRGTSRKHDGQWGMLPLAKKKGAAWHEINAPQLFFTEIV